MLSGRRLKNVVCQAMSLIISVSTITLLTEMIQRLPQSSHTLTPEKKILVGVDTLASIDPDILEDSYVYVHCQFPIPTPGILIRIWKTTVLKDCHSSG